LQKSDSRSYPAYPRVGVGILVFRGEHILLVKRARPPSEGKWTIPGGLVELGETLQQAAKRELLEECGIEVTLGDIISTFDIIHQNDNGQVNYHYVIVDFVADFFSGDLRADSDVKDARWMLPSEIYDFDVPEMTRKLILKVTKKCNFK
jgi:8-oxo-dGTP diphosphatase